MSSVQDFARLVEQRPDAPAIHFQGQTLTRADVWRRAELFAATLANLGIQAGDRVAIARRNSPSHITAWLGAQWLGASLVPLNHRLAAAEMACVLDDCAAKVVVCGERQAIALDPWASERPDVAWLVEGASTAQGLSDAWRAPSEVDIGSPGSPLRLDPRADSLLIYTSGTTGRAKGVRITEGNLRASWENMQDVLPTGQQDVALTVAAYGHVGGINTFGLQTVIEGGQLAIERQFDPGETLALIESHRVTVGFLVPAMCQAILAHPALATTDLSSLRGFLIGGANVTTQLLAEGAAHGLPLLLSWGMTECAGGGTILRADQAERHQGSIGLPMRHVEVRLIDPEGRPITVDGRVGEMLVRGPNVSPGYWHLPQADAATFVNGWLHTGDLVMRDAEQFLYLIGRRHGVIVSGGEKIYPVELERALLTHPDVSDAAVVGVPDPRWGETPFAFVVPREGNSPSLGELRDHLALTLARFKLPSHLRLLVTMPLSSTLKVDYKALSAMACQEVAGR